MLPNGNTYLSDFWANETFDIQKAVSLWYQNELYDLKLEGNV